MDISRRELLTGALAVSAAAVLPALPAFAEDAVYIKANPSLGSGAWVASGPYEVGTHLIKFQGTVYFDGGGLEFEQTLPANADYGFVAEIDDKNRIVGVRAVEPRTVIHKRYAEA